MKATYIIHFNDYFTLFLFNASRSASVKKRRGSAVSLPAAAGIFFALYHLLFGNPFLGCAVFIISLIWFFVYPQYEAERYRKHYRDYIRENLSQNIEKEMSIAFTETNTVIASEDSHGEISYRLFEDISEVPDYIFIKLRSSESLILPLARLDNAEELRSYLAELSLRLSIPYHTHGQWRWK